MTSIFQSRTIVGQVLEIYAIVWEAAAERVGLAVPAIEPLVDFGFTVFVDIPVWAVIDVVERCGGG